MKSSVYFFAAMFLCGMLSFETTNAQLWKKIKDEVKNRAENNAVNKAGNTTDKVMNNPSSVLKKNQGNASSDNNSPINDDLNSTPASTIADYKNYDFVPGDKIIFEPDLRNESDAELPARFTVNSGNAEIQTYEGEKILHLNPDCQATVSPLMNSDNYLPDQYTFEFDMMYENKDGNFFKYVSDFSVNFRKPGDKNYHSYPFFDFVIDGTSKIKFGDVNASPVILQHPLTGNTWHHIAIYIHKNIGKVYIDQYRVSAINTLPAGAGKIDIKADRYGIKIKNVRLAAGGDDKYNKIITDGKIVTHILFDVNKSTIKPESTGTLNEIAKLLKDHSDLKLEIDGYTDSDGGEDANMKLSQNRADAVRSQLVEMGIDQSRLTAKGFGETKPIDNNDSAEGKANNRRVEFVKM